MISKQPKTGGWHADDLRVKCVKFGSKQDKLIIKEWVCYDNKRFFFINDWPKVLRVFMSIYIIHNPMVLFQSTMGTFQPVAAAMGVFP